MPHIKNLRFFSNLIVKRAEDRLDSLSIVESGSVKGTGKSVFSKQQSEDICNHPDVNYPYQMFDSEGKSGLMLLDATEQKLKSLVKTLPFGVPIHIDEAVFVAYKRDYQEEAVKKLVKFINICRKFRKPIFLNIPSFWDLDKDVRNLAEYRITIIKRGIACIRGKYPNPEYDDLWLRDESKKKIDKAIGSDITDLNGVIRGIRSCRNHLFDIIFPNMTEAEYSIYEKKSMEIEGEQMDKDTKRNDVIIRLFASLLLDNYAPKELERLIKDNLIESYYKEELTKFSVPSSSLRRWNREWKDARRRS